MKKVAAVIKIFGMISSFSNNTHKLRLYSPPSYEGAQLANRTKTVARATQNNRFDKEKQCLCTCVLHLVHFFAVPCQTTTQMIKLERPGEREHTTVKFPFSI